MTAAVAGKAKAGMAHATCGRKAGCAGKTVISLDNACYTLSSSSIPQHPRDVSCIGAIQVDITFTVTCI